MTMTVEEDEDIVRISAKTDKICAVNYCYSACPMVRQARAMVRAGELGRLRLIVTNFSHGLHGDAPTPTIRASAGAMTPPWPACRAGLPIVASMRCTWRQRTAGTRPDLRRGALTGIRHLLCPPRQRLRLQTRSGGKVNLI